MRKMICLLSLMFVLVFASYASEIRRITLAELQSKADLIVLAKVTNAKKDKNIDHITIQIDSFIKGKSPQKVYTFTLVTRGGLKDFDPALTNGDTGVFFLKLKKLEGQVEKAYWGSIAIFAKNHFDLTEKKKKF